MTISGQRLVDSVDPLSDSVTHCERAEYDTISGAAHKLQTRLNYVLLGSQVQLSSSHKISIRESSQVTLQCG